jgi:hypothetical protein
VGGEEGESDVGGLNHPVVGWNDRLVFLFIVIYIDRETRTTLGPLSPQLRSAFQIFHSMNAQDPVQKPK